MSRRHAHLIEVETEPAPAGPVPAAFTWRGRRYLVQEVLAGWSESGSWWRGTARALAEGTAAGELDDRPQQWWRVEAGSGRRLGAGPGVYDLCFEESAARWSLRRVMD